MDQKKDVIDTLEFLSQELLREKFILKRLKRESKELTSLRQKTRKKIAEIRARINYNLDKHGKTIGYQESAEGSEE